MGLVDWWWLTVVMGVTLFRVCFQSCSGDWYWSEADLDFEWSEEDWKEDDAFASLVEGMGSMGLNKETFYFYFYFPQYYYYYYYYYKILLLLLFYRNFPALRTLPKQTFGFESGGLLE